MTLAKSMDNTPRYFLFTIMTNKKECYNPFLKKEKRLVF